MENPGQWIQQKRQSLGLRKSDIQKLSEKVAESKKNQEYYLSHQNLSSIEAGRLPNMYWLFTLAVCLRVSYGKMLQVYDIDTKGVEEFLGESSPEADVKAANLQEGWIEPAINFENHPAQKQTALIWQDAKGVPNALLQRFELGRYVYAVIGLEDDMMNDILPPGSVVEVDKEQNQVQMTGWTTMRERPIYLVWHDDGHSCCWCQVDGNELTLVPYPGSSRPLRRFKLPREASVIGRLVHVWAPLEPVKGHLD